MMRKRFKKIVILSVFFLLVFGLGSDSSIADKPGQVVSICIDVFGDDIIMGPACGDQSIIGRDERKNYTKQVVVWEANFSLPYFLDYEFRPGILGLDCFSTIDCGPVVVSEEKDGTYGAHFWLHGDDGDGIPEGTIINYGIYLYDGTKDGPWPPLATGSTTVFQFTKWEIFTEGRGGPRKKCCVGGNDNDPLFLVSIEVSS